MLLITFVFNVIIKKAVKHKLFPFRYSIRIKFHSQGISEMKNFKINFSKILFYRNTIIGKLVHNSFDTPEDDTYS